MYPHKTWHMPDGTKAASKPNDGQIWTRWDLTGNEVEKWQWEGTRDCWVNVSSGKPTKANTATYVITPLDLDNIDPSDYSLDYQHALGAIADSLSYKAPRCDCGSLKVGSPRHSNWCQMYNPAQ